MKTMAQMAAILSFTCFFVAGAWIILLMAASTRTEGPLPVCIGLCLMGTAFYLGPKLWLAADSRGVSVPEAGTGFSGFWQRNAILFRYAGVAFAVLVAGMIGIMILRFVVQ